MNPQTFERQQAQRAGEGLPFSPKNQVGGHKAKSP